jgi:hypothetical protein
LRLPALYVRFNKVGTKVTVGFCKINTANLAEKPSMLLLEMPLCNYPYKSISFSQFVRPLNLPAFWKLYFILDNIFLRVFPDRRAKIVSKVCLSISVGFVIL